RWPRAPEIGYQVPVSGAWHPVRDRKRSHRMREVDLQSAGALLLWGFLFFSLRSTVFVSTGLWLLGTGWGQARRVYRRPFAPGQVRKELLSAVGILAVDAFVQVLVHALGLIHFVPASVSNVAFTFLAMFVFFEAWFYATHRLFHTRAFYWIHAQHHVAK